MNFAVPSWNDRGFFTYVTLSERYVVKVLGISPKILVESGMSSSVNKMILKEYLLKEGWWDTVKQKVGTGVESVKSVAQAIQKFGDNVKGVAVGLYHLAQTPDGVSKTIDAAENMVMASLEVIGNLFRGIREVTEKLFDSSGTNPTTQQDQDISTFKKFSSWLQEKEDKLDEVLLNLTGGEGWKSMLSSIAGALIASYISDTIKETAQSLQNAGKELSNIKFIIAEKLDVVGGLLRSVLTYFSATAVASLAGPIAYIAAMVAMYKKYKKVDWVLGKIKEVLSKVGPISAKPGDKPQPTPAS